MNTCKTCKHWAKGEEKHKDCEHPGIENGPYVRYGADDDYGSYFQTSAEFGCVLWEAA